MKIIKTILLFLVILAILGYLTIAIIASIRHKEERKCAAVEVIYKGDNNNDNEILSKNEVLSLLRHNGVQLNNRDIDSIRLQKVENILNVHPLIDHAECYSTTNNKIYITIYKKRPIMHIFSNKNENYYIDDKGEIMPYFTGCKANLPIATGAISKGFAQNHLYEFAKYLEDDKFWNDQIVQINVVKGNRVILVSRVGNHLIELGTLEDFEEKLDRVKRFYKKALNKVGWNKYSKINAEFLNQIICTKR